MDPPSPRKQKIKGSTTNTKTIKANGVGIARVAQACDRCRAKKTKCDGKVPSCSNCEAIGIKCIVSDKLSRRAYPKGYTEILEDRIRQLEAENQRLGGVIDLKDEQIKSYKSDSDYIPKDEDLDEDLPNRATLSLLEMRKKIEDDTHGHIHGDRCPCGCATDPNSVHERPVSIPLVDGDHGPLSLTDTLNLSDESETNSLLSTDDELISNSLGSILLHRNKLYTNKFNDGAKPAPGAFAAATAIEKMQKTKGSKVLVDKQLMLTALVAASIPRSTEETLFVPTMLASICQVFGYDSKPAILAANAIGSLKENSNEMNAHISTDTKKDEMLLQLIMNKRANTILSPEESAFFLKNLRLPKSRMEMDHLITIYFQEWGSTLPVLTRDSFLQSYDSLMKNLESGQLDPKQISSIGGELAEKFGAILVLVIALSGLSNKHEICNPDSNSYNINHEDMKHYDYLIHEFVEPNCLITNTCSMQSLQILTLSLQYCFAIGDVTTSFVLRGRVITMAQQLRLHRCPAAVLGVSGGNDNKDLRNLQQGERRILFWCVYCLDVYSSFNLGVPRLLKDHEIECALPFAGMNDDEDDDNEKILIVNNARLTIVGKVSNYSLSIMLYCRVLGSILDGIFSSSQSLSTQESTLKMERKLEVWRRELPDQLKFEMGMDGLSLKSENEKSNHWESYSVQQLCLVFLYFHARILIFLPTISKFGNHHDVGLSEKEKLYRGDSNKGLIISSITMIQQSSVQILEILKTLSSPGNCKLLPIPINIPREHARLTLLVAKGTLDYIKGGSLYLSLKQLLLDTIPLIVRESHYNAPGGITKNSANLMEMSILSILGLPLNKNLFLTRRKLSTMPVTKPAVDRGPSSLNQSFSNSGTSSPQISQPYQFNGVTSMGNNYNNISNNGDQTFNNNDFSDTTINENTNGKVNGKSEPSDIDYLFEFDPFKVNLSQTVLVNEFAADGSLGLVPFLNNDTDELDFGNDEMLLSSLNE